LTAGKFQNRREILPISTKKKKQRRNRENGRRRKRGGGKNPMRLQEENKGKRDIGLL